jgi:hypothetical protein
MRNKKSQMQMTENIAIIIVITIILVFGFVFYSNVRKVNITNKLEEYNELELVQISQKVSGLPELSCSVESLVEFGCLNKLKLEAFNALELKDKLFEYYRTIFGRSKVLVKSVYANNQTEFELYDNPYENVGSQKSLYIPINIHNPINDTVDFAYLQIIMYTPATS